MVAVPTEFIDVLAVCLNISIQRCLSLSLQQDDYIPYPRIEDVSHTSTYSCKHICSCKHPITSSRFICSNHTTLPLSQVVLFVHLV